MTVLNLSEDALAAAQDEVRAACVAAEAALDIARTSGNDALIGRLTAAHHMLEAAREQLSDALPLQAEAA